MIEEGDFCNGGAVAGRAAAGLWRAVLLPSRPFKRGHRPPGSSKPGLLKCLGLGGGGARLYLFFVGFDGEFSQRPLLFAFLVVVILAAILLGEYLQLEERECCTICFPSFGPRRLPSLPGACGYAALTGVWESGEPLLLKRASFLKFLLSRASR